MRIREIDIDDRVGKLLEELAAERAIAIETLVAEVLTRHAEVEELKRGEITPEMLKTAEEFAGEDVQLAEAGMDDYARQLAEEDRA